MNFDDTDIGIGLATESELAITLNGGIRVDVVGDWSAIVSARYRTMYTKRRVRRLFIALGIGRTLAAPHWLRQFLR